MARYNVEAIVLKKVNFGETDRIYTLFTKEKGKIRAVAKGVRKISSRRGGNLDTLNLATINLTESNGGFNSIVEVKTLNSHKNIKKTLEKSLAGFYIAEVINKSVEEDSENRELFELLKVSLSVLDIGDKKPGFVVNKFEFLLMKILGYEMSLEKLKSINKNELDNRLKIYVKEALEEDFKSLEI